MMSAVVSPTLNISRKCHNLVTYKELIAEYFLIEIVSAYKLEVSHRYVLFRVKRFLKELSKQQANDF